MSDSMEIRRLIDLHPLADDNDPPKWTEVSVGRNTALLKIEGPLVYATETTAAWLWGNLPSGSFWHELSMERGHRITFLAGRLVSVVQTLRLLQKQVLIV